MEGGVKEASREWKSTYHKQLQGTIDKTPLKVKLDLDNEALKALSKMSSSVKSETKKTEDAIGGLKHQLKALSDEWNKLSASQRAGVEGSRLREQYRNLTYQAQGYSSTLRSAVSAEDKATAAKQRATKATERQTAAYKTQSTYLARLAQRMIAYASVAQAMSFLRNIKDVTAEFELQRVALGSIIGDLNEANAMFEQIKAAAVKSPFQIKELVTYTKQLAAYKIENDELFETTQRLADISAGLGVGMERLVLAYGQIRATGYLRASEVRQLTETGIPIVEELAKKMSDLRGETVSAAEVMQLISERAISFGMVKAVFDDMTSAGGMFYKMQEKQAETLAGQWSNLRDSISIMYEEIGNTEIVNNAMKCMIGLVKSLAENWRTIGIVVVGTLGSFLAMRGVSKMLPNISNYAIRSAQATRRYKRAVDELRIAMQNGDRALIRSARSNLRYAVMMRNAEKASSAFMRSLKRLWATLVANHWTAILTALAALASVLYSAYENATRLDKELASIESRGKLEGDQQVRNFERLADVVKSSANGSKQQTDAIKELKRSYGDFLPMQDEEIRKLLSTEGGYRAVSSAIREKIALQIQEQKVSAATNSYSDKIGELQGEMRASLEDAGLSRDEISRFFAELEKAVKDGTLDTGAAFAESLEKIFKQSTNLDWDWLKIIDETTSGLIGQYNIYALIDALEEYEKKIKDIESETQASKNAFDAYNQKYEDLQKRLKELSSDKPMFSFEWDEDMRTKQIEEYRKTIKELIDEAKNNEGLSQDDYNRLIGMDNLDAVFNTLEQKVPAMAGTVRKLRDEWANLIPTPMTQSINAQIISIAKTMGIPMDKVKTLLKQNSEDYGTWAQRLKGIFDKSKGDVVAWRKTVNAALLFNPYALEGAQGELEDAEDWKDFLTRLNNAFQFSGGTGGGGGGRQKDAWVASMEEKIKYVQDFQKGVENLAKTMPRDVAIIREQMIMLNRGVSLGFDPKTMQGSSEELIAWYKKAIDDTQKKIQGFKGFRGLTVEQILSNKTTNATVKEYQALLQQLYNALTDFETSQVARDMEKKIKKLSDDLSRTKTAKEFFDKMLGMTGDKELSATLTVSIYGGVSSENLGETLAKDMAKKLEAQVQEYFGDIDISSAINKATGEIDPIKLSALIDADKMGEKNVDAVYKIIADLQSANSKYWNELMKDLEQTKTYGEKLVKIYETTQERLAKIDAREDLDADTKRKLKDRVKGWQGKEMQKLQYEAFKDSPMYVAMFEKLDTTSTTMLTNMRNHLVKLKSEWKNLDPTQPKELQSRINDIDNQLSTRNPFKGIVDGIKAMNKLGSRKEDEQDLLFATQRRLEAQKMYDKAVSEGKSPEVISYLAQKLDDCVKSEDEAAKKMSEWDDATRKVMQGMQNLSRYVELIQATSTAVNDVVQAFGGWDSTADEEFWNTIIEGMGGILQGSQSSAEGVARIMSGDIIGGVTSLVSGIGSIISSITNLAYAGTIKRANQEIERQQELLDNLSYSYDRLQKSAEKAFGTDYIQNYNRQLENLEAQQEAYLAQADAERSKGKKADEDKIKDYEKQARDTADEIKDMYGSLSEHFLGTDLTSAARDFASAWIDAYKEFSNTTDAMKQKFQDMIQNMVVESLLAKVMEKALEPVFAMIDEMGDGDFYSTSFWQDVMSTMQTATENGVVGAQNIMSMLEQMGINLRGLGGEMTGISRDIATASEESILGLAAGINTQNFYISQVPTKLDTIIGLLRGDGAIQQGGKITLQDVMIAQNQFLSHLPTIAQHTAETVAECKAIVVETRRTADALDRVIKPDGTRTTYKMNVVTTYQG